MGDSDNAGSNVVSAQRVRDAYNLGGALGTFVQWTTKLKPADRDAILEAFAKGVRESSGPGTHFEITEKATEILHSGGIR